jgi:hypothetical protein
MDFLTDLDRLDWVGGMEAMLRDASKRHYWEWLEEIRELNSCRYKLSSSQGFLKASNGYSIKALKSSVALQKPWSSEFMAHEDLKLSLVNLLTRPF